MAKFDTQVWRDRYDSMVKRLGKLYDARMPVLANYEATVNQTLDELIGSTVPAMQSMFRQATGIGDIVEGEYLPAAREYMQKARGYDTPERRASESAKAMADVGAAGEASRKAAIANLESYGIDPSMTRGAALDQNVRLQTALEQVRAGREAASDVEEKGQAYLRDALGVGQQLQAGGLQTAELGGRLGDTATRTASDTAATFANIFGTPLQNMQLRGDFTQASSGLKSAEAQFKQAKSGGSPWAGIGQTVGLVGGTALGGYLGGTAGAQLGAQIGSQAGGQASASFLAQQQYQ